MSFHSHQLRDTFAVNRLLNGTSMEDLSQMLSHSSIKISEKYYSPWVPERQTALEQKMTEALLKMGVFGTKGLWSVAEEAANGTLTYSQVADTVV